MVRITGPTRWFSWSLQQYTGAFSPLRKRCYETLLPFSFKWQPNIATPFHARRPQPSCWVLTGTFPFLSHRPHPADGVSASLLHPPLPRFAAEIGVCHRAHPGNSAVQRRTGAILASSMPVMWDSALIRIHFKAPDPFQGDSE